MKVRAITTGINLSLPFDGAAFAKAADFCKRTKEAIEQHGIEVQTTRVVGSTLNGLLHRPGAVVKLARILDAACTREGIDYCSVGCIDTTGAHAPLVFAGELSQAISETERIFACVLASSNGMAINRDAVLECARTVLQISRSTTDGFRCMRFAVGANTSPNGPFFPTSYHDGGPTAFSLALEAADVPGASQAEY